MNNPGYIMASKVGEKVEGVYGHAFIKKNDLEKKGKIFI
jgi:hypothetical protein